MNLPLFMLKMEFAEKSKGRKDDMYLHIGKDCVIKKKDIIGIFNIEYIKNTKEYKSMYTSLAEKYNLINVSDKQNKTFILVENNKKIRGYITNIGSNTIGKRRM